MKDKLNKNEQELLKSIENEEWESITNLESKKSFYQVVAERTLKKSQRN